MIQLCRTRIYPENLEVLYDRPFSKESVAEDFEIKGGNWYVDEEGWLVGENRENFAAMIMSKAGYYGDVLIEFDAATVKPATRDINVTWHGCWDEEKNRRGTAYVVGIQGWWNDMVGFERSPDLDFMVQTKLLDFEPGKVYHVVAGNVGNNLFFAIDGRVALEITDPDPIDIENLGLIGFEAYCTRVKYKNLKVKRAVSEYSYVPYEPEF